jgi:hypothetical protein
MIDIEATGEQCEWEYSFGIRAQIERSGLKPAHQGRGCDPVNSTLGDCKGAVPHKRQGHCFPVAALARDVQGQFSLAAHSLQAEGVPQQRAGIDILKPQIAVKAWHGVVHGDGQSPTSLPAVERHAPHRGIELSIYEGNADGARTDTHVVELSLTDIQVEIGIKERFDRRRLGGCRQYLVDFCLW